MRVILSGSEVERWTSAMISNIPEGTKIVHDPSTTPLPSQVLRALIKPEATEQFSGVLGAGHEGITDSHVRAARLLLEALGEESRRDLAEVIKGANYDTTNLHIAIRSQNFLHSASGSMVEVPVAYLPAEAVVQAYVGQ